jgi:hypothetical protein
MCGSGFGELFSHRLCARHIAEIVKGSLQFDAVRAGESDRLDAACDQAIAACDDLRSAIRALILANEYLE